MSNIVKNHSLAKSVSDASWYQFRMFLEYFGKVFGRITIAVNPASQAKNVVVVGRSLRRGCPPDRIYVCKCGCEMDTDPNVAINILASRDRYGRAYRNLATRVA